MLKSDEILIIGKIGPRISVAISKNYGKIKFIGSQHLLTLSVYSVTFYVSNSELFRVKESRFLYSFYPIVKSYNKYKYAISVIKLINRVLPVSSPFNGLYEDTINYLKYLMFDEENVRKYYMLWLYRLISSVLGINHLLYCKSCGNYRIRYYIRSVGGFCELCKSSGDFDINVLEFEFLENLNKLNFDSIRYFTVDFEKLIKIFEDLVYSY
ncbi:MAG: hypothetical protein N2504_04135 [candidate division WOR-3 bacterium]|nr:hypothetical protein [candidate division WOR-3 bacterium]MCX7947757.1 hypothetical protein [candidate division WOR-3 bacterium]MDW8150320.1 hypothetical protein [candidate division WOR-3 bacterium]